MITGNYYKEDHEMYFREVSMQASGEIVSQGVKTQILNNLKSMLEDLLNQEFLKDEPDEQILSMINANLMVIEDAYIVDLYKFQFQAITNIISVEIKNIKDLVSLSQ